LQRLVEIGRFLATDLACGRLDGGQRGAELLARSAMSASFFRQFLGGCTFCAQVLVLLFQSRDALARPASISRRWVLVTELTRRFCL
jgi:hypothetical protein